MSMHGGSGGVVQSIIVSALDGGKWSNSRPIRFKPEEEAHTTHMVEG
jgi:hypothetical protein